VKAGLLALLALTLCATDFWETKTPESWSTREIEKLLTHSPWSHQLTVQFEGGRIRNTRQLPAPGVDASSNEPGRSPAAQPPIPEAPVIPIEIRWHSAPAVRQALIRTQQLNPNPYTTFAGKPGPANAPGYIIVVSGFPQGMGSGPAGILEKTLFEGCALAVKGRAPIKPIGVDVAPIGRTLDAMITFPKTDPLSMDDKEVEFSMPFEARILRVKFRLAEMRIGGRLDL
jgi:hypothetical protein